jgi:hypothetical protein
MAHDVTLERAEQNYFRPDSQKVRSVAQTIEHGYFTNYATYPVKLQKKGNCLLHRNICNHPHPNKKGNQNENSNDGTRKRKIEEAIGKRKREERGNRGEEKSIILFFYSIKFAFIIVQMSLN